MTLAASVLPTASKANPEDEDEDEEALTRN
jgi:hypothetical protein